MAAFFVGTRVIHNWEVVLGQLQTTMKKIPATCVSIPTVRFSEDSTTLMKPPPSKRAIYEVDAPPSDMIVYNCKEQREKDAREMRELLSKSSGNRWIPPNLRKRMLNPEKNIHTELAYTAL